MSNIAKLRSIARPPSNPKGPGTPAQWSQLETELHLNFPQDFKELVSTYGAGNFTNFFGVEAPFYSSPRYGPYRDWIRLMFDGVKLAKSSYPEEAVPLPVYPENGGLFPWGYTHNGGAMWWLTEGESAHWPIICLDDGNTKDFDRFDLPVVEFIEKWLTDQILVPTLTPPDFYPLRQPVFSPA